MQAGVGHYGVFSGKRFEREIYPEISLSSSPGTKAPAAADSRRRRGRNGYISSPPLTPHT